MQAGKISPALIGKVDYPNPVLMIFVASIFGLNRL
jgi:hypothetical protein